MKRSTIVGMAGPRRRSPGTRRVRRRRGQAMILLAALIGFLVIAASKLMHWASVDINNDWKTTLAVDAVIILTAYLLRARAFRFALAMAVLILTYHSVLPQFYGSSQFVYTARNFFGVKGIKIDLGTNSTGLGSFVRDDQTTGFSDRSADPFAIQRSECSQVEHFDLDAFTGELFRSLQRVMEH